MKYVKIILVNFIVIVLLSCFAEWICLYVLLFPTRHIYKINPVTLSEIMLSGTYEDFYHRHAYRPIENKESKNKPVVFFGCSYAGGYGSIPELKDDETISAFFARNLKEKRPVYNRGIGSQSVQAAIWQLEEGGFLEEIKEPEFVIYIFINDQIRRLYKECSPCFKSPLYKKKGDSIKLIKNPFYYSYLMILYRYKIQRKYYKVSKEENFDFLRRHFLYLKKLGDKKWKNTKWIILYYNDDGSIYPLEELEKDGFKVIKLTSLVSPEFFTDEKNRSGKDNPHPSKYAWETIGTALYDKLHELYNLN